MTSSLCDVRMNVHVSIQAFELPGYELQRASVPSVKARISVVETGLQPGQLPRNRAE